MTQRLYYTEPYRAEFEASVTRAFTHEGRPAVSLDRTAFYPTSGGQPHDLGALGPPSPGFGEAGPPLPGFGGAGPARVVDVIDLDDGTIAHVLSEAIAEGTRVRGEIDWHRRFDHMQQHTGQHVLSSAFDRLAGNRTVSFHMGADVSTIDLAAEAPPDAIAAAEREANRIVWENRPVSIRFVSADEAAALPLRKEPARQGPLRLIDIEECDLSACGGTHVARTGAIGVVAVTAWERFRGGSRVTFVCGGRALRTFRVYRDSVTRCTRALSVLPDELPAAIDRVHGESKELRRQVKTLQEQLAAHEGARLVAEAAGRNFGSGSGAVRLIVRALEGWDAAGLKAIAAAATACDDVVVALFSASAPAVAVVARSRNVAVDAQAVLKRLVELFGGRGGGKPDLAQGGGLDADINHIVARARTAIEQQLRGS